MFLIDYGNTVFQELLRSVLAGFSRRLACPRDLFCAAIRLWPCRRVGQVRPSTQGAAAGVRYGLGVCLPRRSSLTSTPPTISAAPRMASPGSRSPAMRPTMPAQTGSLA